MSYIPQIIHYCWFGNNPLTPLAEQCLFSWKAHMPDWTIMRWDEDSLTRVQNQPNPCLCPEGKGDGHWYDYPICREIINVMIQMKRKIVGIK